MKKYLLIILGAVCTLIITGILLFLSVITNTFAVTVDTENVIPRIKVAVVEYETNIKEDLQKIDPQIRNEAKLVYNGNEPVEVCDSFISNVPGLANPFWSVSVNDQNEMELTKKASDVNFIINHGILIVNNNRVSLDLNGTKYVNKCITLDGKNE